MYIDCRFEPKLGVASRYALYSRPPAILPEGSNVCFCIYRLEADSSKRGGTLRLARFIASNEKMFWPCLLF